MRRTASCTRSGEATLRLRADDEWIRIELEIEHGRHGGKWAVILLHERRIVYRGTVGSATTARFVCAAGCRTGSAPTRSWPARLRRRAKRAASRQRSSRRRGSVRS